MYRFTFCADWLSLSLLPFSLILTWLKSQEEKESEREREKERKTEREREEEGKEKEWEAEREWESQWRNAETEIPFSSPIPLLISHTDNTVDPGCRWWLHSATAVGWWLKELELSVYRPVVLPRQCCCQMGFKQWVLLISGSTACRFLFLLNTTAGDRFTLHLSLLLVWNVLLNVACSTA